jgi:hypothetical protein
MQTKDRSPATEFFGYKPFLRTALQRFDNVNRIAQFDG